MDSELATYILGSLTSEDPIKRALVVGGIAWLAVQYVVKPWVADNRWYVPAALAVACGLNLLAAAATDRAYLVAVLYGLAVGLMASGGHELRKVVARLLKK